MCCCRMPLYQSAMMLCLGVRMRSIAMLSLVVALLAGCDASRSDFPIRTEAVQEEVEELATNVTIVKLTSDNIASFASPRAFSGSTTNLPSQGAREYRIGVGDILDIVVWEHPELTMPAGDSRTPQESGLRVQSDGTFFYPYVGQVLAKGRTPEEVRADLSVKLGEFVPDPQMEVRVVGYNSQSVSVTGEVKTPNRQQIRDIPLTLLEAIDAAGGLSDEAEPRRVTVRRAGKTYLVDLNAFLSDGASANNPLLRPGDIVNVPRQKLQEVYLLGQISEPTTIDVSDENVTLTQALARVGGLKEDSADARGIFVFRSVSGAITVYQLDASNPAAYLLGTKFYLLPEDVVYVTTAPLYRWNRTISSILPTLTIARTASDINNN